MWKINQELRELYKYLDMTSDIKKNRLEWVGHVVRLDQVRRVKKIIESKPEGSKEGEDLDDDGWKMWKRVCERRRLRDGGRRQSIEKKGLP